MSKFGLIDNTLEGRQRIFFPHWSNGTCPTDPEKNKAYRRRLYSIANRAEQRLLKKMCAEDALFWIFSFGYCYNAGDEGGEPGPVPFLLFDYQVECFTAMWSAMHERRCPLREKKPRRTSATWRCVFLFNHCWQFMKNRHLLVGSAREENVDGTASMSKGGDQVGEWSKLLPKFDFVHLHQPQWLLPEGYTPRVEPYRTRMKIMNPEMGSIIWGTSASSIAGHGERGYACWWDECSRTENLHEIIGGLNAFSPARFWISTIGNLSHTFSTTLKEAPGVMQLAPQWWMDPQYTEGMTINADGERTSPWLQKKLAEINHDPVLANQLYFADETKQVGGYYSPDAFRTMMGTADKPGTVCDPFDVGELDIMDQANGPRAIRFCSQRSGRWKFWFHPDGSGRPPRNTRYIFGIDIAAGTTDSGGRGSSNSVIAVADWRTGEIVAEYVSSDQQPFELARTAVAAAGWFEGDDFQGALMVPEAGGPGSQFIDCVLRRNRYLNVWMRDVAEQKYGFTKAGHGGGEEARKAFGLHQEMICDGRLKERSIECVKEMRHYQHNPNGNGPPVHTASLMSEDPSGARDNHGDRTIARICICQVLKQPYDVTRIAGDPPAMSYRALKKARERDEFEDGEAEAA